MKKSSRQTVGLNVTRVLVMAEDRINNSNFSNIRAIAPLLLSNPDNIYVHNHTWSYIFSISVMKFSLSLSFSLSLEMMFNYSHQFFSQVEMLL